MTGPLVHAPHSVTGVHELADAARRAGLTVTTIGTAPGGGVDLAALRRAAVPGAAYRSAGGPLARVMAGGAPVELFGAAARWFAALPAEVTGRVWALTDLAGARRALTRGPAFVKLAEAKFRALPARRYATPAQLDLAAAHVHAPADLAVLVTAGWLALHSEYRTFTAGREVVAVSPYLVEDEVWSPLLHTHRASFDDDAAAFVAAFLAGLPADEVPPSAVLDVARTTDGRFVVLEVNHVWSSGLYGCDPEAVLRAVLAAVGPAAPRWRWTPDPGVLTLSR